MRAASDIAVTIDAEEADRHEIMLDLFEQIVSSDDLKGWSGFGLVVQAYQKRAVPTLSWLIALARRLERRIPVRLVKGAYWDTEIKRAQEAGLPDYPVFTRKAATDTSYIACARTMLAARDAIYPQFATHNAHTLSAVEVLTGGKGDFEYQRLHGMGESLYALYHEVKKPAAAVGAGTRIYAPVGSHEDLLAYLVRRLLENGANTSFVNRFGRRRGTDRSADRGPDFATREGKALAQPAHSAAGRSAAGTRRTRLAFCGAIRMRASRCSPR